MSHDIALSIKLIDHYGMNCWSDEATVFTNTVDKVFLLFISILKIIERNFNEIFIWM